MGPTSAVGAASPLVASAAGAPDKPVKISGAKAPKAIDLPGAANDVVRITNAPGVRWSWTGKDDGSTSTSEKTIDVPIGDLGSVTVSATAVDGYVIASDITSWTLPFTTTKEAIDSATVVAPVAVDLPGSKKDAVVVTNTPGVDWVYTSGGAPKKIPAFKGTSKSFVLSKLVGDASSVILTATPQPGYEGLGDPAPSVTLAVTAAETVSLDKDSVKNAVSVTNLPGRSRDTVQIRPVLGVKWRVCGTKTITVKKPVTLPATCRNSSGDLAITAVADKGFTIGGEPHFAIAKELPDGTPRVEVTVADGVRTAKISFTVDGKGVAQYNGPGASRDALYFTQIPHVVWQYAYPVTKKGVVEYKWANAPKPKKGQALSELKIKAAKGAEKTTVYVRPVAATADYAIDGWEQTSEGGSAAVTFTSTPKPLTVGEVDFASDKKSVTLPAIDGIASWAVTQAVTADGKKDKTQTSKIVVAPYASVVVQLSGGDVKVVPVPDKDHSVPEGTVFSPTTSTP